MKKLRILLFAFFLHSAVQSQNIQDIDNLKLLINDLITPIEFNPLYKAEEDTLISNFHKAIISYKGAKNFEVEYNWKHASLLRSLYNNSSGVYEDSPDIRRLKLKRGICYANLALITDYFKAPTFIAFAEISLDEEFLESKLLGVKLTKLLIYYYEKTALEYELKKIEQYLITNKEHISLEILKRTKEICTKFKK